MEIFRIKPYQCVHSGIHIATISRYINGLHLDDTIKKQILNQKFINDNPSLYTYYPYMFCKAMCTKKNVEKLNIAGFLYYKSIIHLDELLDSNRSEVRNIIFISICQEECIKLLSSLFPPSSPFWLVWNRRRYEYLKAYSLDRTIKEIDSFEDFEKLADYKSAFGKIAIDGLYLMSKKKKSLVYDKILESHKFFYVGFQILDDIEDLVEDLQNGQFNIALNCLKQELGSRNIEINTQTDEALVKYLYIFGVAEELLDKCILSLNKSEQIISEHSLSIWQSEIIKLRNIAITKKANIQAYIRSLIVSAKLSDKVRDNEIKFDEIINLSVNFLKKFQNLNGSWQEYYNDAGLSDSWSTAFILNYLCQNAMLNKQFVVPMKKGFDFLKNSENDGFWGYNKEWISDLDSTTFALFAMYRYYGKDKSVPLINKWFGYQNEDGGFATYKNNNDILSFLNSSEPNKCVEGWTTSHICVSAVAFYFLSAINHKTTYYSKLEKYLIGVADVNGLWDAYWWTSPIYSTSFMIKSVDYIQNKKLLKLIDNSSKQIIELQNKNGSFGDKYVANSPFYTGLVVDAICEIPRYYKMYMSQIDNAVDWLRNSQLEDGSWVATSAMRMPDSTITDPSVIVEWPEDTKGLNIRVKEFNRLFSTVVSVSSLLKYDKISKK